jgi:hypothetical protein
MSVKHNYYYIYLKQGVNLLWLHVSVNHWPSSDL